MAKLANYYTAQIFGTHRDRYRLQNPQLVYNHAPRFFRITVNSHRISDAAYKENRRYIARWSVPAFATWE